MKSEEFEDYFTCLVLSQKNCNFGHKIGINDRNRIDEKCTTNLIKRHQNMKNPIPNFDHNLVIPPHLGNPTLPSDVSPYKCTSLELCEKFATSPQRIDILKGFISFRQKLTSLGLTNGFQWLDGSFLEDVESREQRPPNDLDLVTIFWGYDLAFQIKLITSFPEFADSQLSKQNYLLDHYPFNASKSPLVTVNYSGYWMQLFSHNRDGVWKGMLQVELNTPNEDISALQYLNTK